ncbi:hypothetical protein [Mucilaginibacter sp.]|uniref:hypothetical protein n=1 Tax=Mucilaginibacter sp. TaxID=1882438 RepID=UPI002635047B|nr:hypothetical protein [Mucilaginibacter sp.]
MKFNLDFNTAYNQFYVVDKFLYADADTGCADFWTDYAFDNRLAVSSGVLGIGIESYGHVIGQLEVLSSENQSVDLNLYDHVVEGYIELESGTLQVLDCPHSAIELETLVQPGPYRVKVYSSNLANTDIDENEGDDYYKIEIWPGSNKELKVLKKFIR